MTRTGKKLLAAAALSTLAAPGLAAANPNAAPAPAVSRAQLLDPQPGCMVKLWDPATRSFWYVGNGKNMPDQASVAECKQLQAVLTAQDKLNKAPVQAPYKSVNRKEWATLVGRLMPAPAVATTAGK